MVRDVEAINWPFKGYFFFVETVQDIGRAQANHSLHGIRKSSDGGAGSATFARVVDLPRLLRPT